MELLSSCSQLHNEKGIIIIFLEGTLIGIVVGEH